MVRTCYFTSVSYCLIYPLLTTMHFSDIRAKFFSASNPFQSNRQFLHTHCSNNCYWVFNCQPKCSFPVKPALTSYKRLASSTKILQLPVLCLSSSALRVYLVISGISFLSSCLPCHPSSPLLEACLVHLQMPRTTPDPPYVCARLVM